MNRAVAVFAVVLLLLVSTPITRAEDMPMLKDVYADYFKIGFAANSAFGLTKIFGHFNSVTSENNMKWRRFSLGQVSFGLGVQMRL